MNFLNVFLWIGKPLPAQTTETCVLRSQSSSLSRTLPRLSHLAPLWPSLWIHVCGNQAAQERGAQEATLLALAAARWEVVLGPAGRQRRVSAESALVR